MKTKIIVYEYLSQPQFSQAIKHGPNTQWDLSPCLHAWLNSGDWLNWGLKVQTPLKTKQNTPLTQETKGFHIASRASNAGNQIPELLWFTSNLT